MRCARGCRCGSTWAYVWSSGLPGKLIPLSNQQRSLHILIGPFHYLILIQLFVSWFPFVSLSIFSLVLGHHLMCRFLWTQVMRNDLKTSIVAGYPMAKSSSEPMSPSRIQPSCASPLKWKAKQERRGHVNPPKPGFVNSETKILGSQGRQAVFVHKANILGSLQAATASPVAFLGPCPESVSVGSKSRMPAKPICFDGVLS